MAKVVHTNAKRMEDRLQKIAEGWNWDNLDDKWTILEGAYCRLSWVVDGLCNSDSMIDDEYKDIINDTLDIIEALQAVYKQTLK